MDSYRSLAAWQLAHRVTIATLRGIDDAYHPRARSLLEQLRRAVVSIEANIVEGYALGTPRYFLKHLRIAFGSAAEAEILIQVRTTHYALSQRKGPTNRPGLALRDDT